MSLGIKAPLFLSTLFAVVVGITSWTTYRDRVRADRQEATVRLDQVAAEMVDGLEQIRQQLAQDMATAAANRSVQDYLGAAPSRRPTLAPLAVAALRAVGSPRELVGIELRDAAGNSALRLGAPEQFMAGAGAVVRDAADSAGLVVGPLQVAHDLAAYPAAIRVTRHGRIIGYVIAWRRLNASPEGARQVSRLVGAGARVLVGNPHDSAWTNLSARANPPPIDVDTATGVLEYQRRVGRVLAVARRVPGLPWAVVVEFPADSVAAPARSGLHQLLVVDLAVWLLGMLGALWLGRRLVGRLGALTASAGAMAGGAPPSGRRRGGDEIKQLTATFDAMAARVRDAIAAAGTSEAQYRKLFESIPLPTYVVDIETMRFLAVNEAAIAHYGYTREEFLAMTARDIRPPDEVPRVEAEVRSLGPVPQPRGTWRHTRKDGTWLEVEVTGHEIEFDGRRAALAVINDVTERNRQQAAVRQSEERYRALIREAPYGIAMSTLSGVFIDANPALVRILGYDTAGDLVGTPVHDVYADPDSRRAVAAELREVGSAHREALQWRRRDGGLVTARLTARVVPGRDDAEPYVEAIIEDVTDRVRLEEQFQQAQRMEAIGRLAGGIAHDFNNLLTVIMTTTELLMSWQPGDPPPTGELDEVYRAARRGADLTRQLLAFGRRQVLAMRPLSVGALVLDMEGMLRRLLGEDVQLRVVASAEPDIVRADQSQLEQVLMNLVVNARDAMPEGGQIVVETGPVELAQGEMAGHPAMAPGAYVRIAVSDTGTGIPPDAMEHLFEPFFTTKPKDKGTGLGLATVYGIVKQLGGYVWPYSEPGQGTTFKIFLPRVDDAAPAAHAEPARREDQRGHQTILVAEDESAIRALLERVLRSRGYDVIAAASGEDALRAVADRRGPIHLLVSDVVMPGMSGPQLAARLAELHPEAVPLFLSGYTDEAVLRLGVAAGRVAFLQKPFTHEEFLVKVRELLENGESTTR
ncbi:MAG: PAS domain S-box protein [Gemmatimonadota bacterium]|nr:PAS domain S-box protein [Gemmatimonadota bacterium]